MILSGGTAKLSGIDEWIASQIGVPVFVADEPENVVAKGCCLALGNAVRLPMLVESGEKILRRDIMIFLERERFY